MWLLKAFFLRKKTLNWVMWNRNEVSEHYRHQFLVTDTVIARNHSQKRPRRSLNLTFHSVQEFKLSIPNRWLSNLFLDMHMYILHDNSEDYFSNSICLPVIKICFIRQTNFWIASCITENVFVWLYKVMNLQLQNPWKNFRKSIVSWFTKIFPWLW